MTRGGRGPRRPGAAVLLVATLLTAVLTTALATVVSAPSASAAPGDIEVDLVSVGPDVLAPGTTLAVTAVVRNDGAETLVAPLVRLELAPASCGSRGAVAGWATAEDDEFSGSRVAEVPLPEGIAPGAEVTVELSVPADELPLVAEPTAWGPRGISVSVRDAEFAQVALTRSHVVWFPGRSFSSPLQTSVLVPLSGVAPEVATGLVPADALEDLTADGGRLAAVLEAASAPGVTWALDPALLASAAAVEAAEPTEEAEPTEAADAADPPTSVPADPSVTASPTSIPPSESPTTGPPTTDPSEANPAEDEQNEAEQDAGRAAATAWLDRLRTGAAEHEVVALPYADPDVAALAHAGEADLHALAEQRGRAAVQELLGEPARTDVAWPASGSIDPVTLDVLAGAGRRAVVLSQGAQPLLEQLPYTPTGRGRLAAEGATVASLLVDTTLSTVLASTGRTGGPSSPSDDVLAVQRLLAETAAITMERPSVDRHVLVTAPRDWAPDPTTGARALAALTAVPWVEVTPLDALVDTQPPDVERAQTADAGDRVGELPAEGLRAAGEALDAVRRMAPALSRPEGVLADAELSAVASTSVAWRGDLEQWEAQVQGFVERSSALLGGVEVVPGSAINVLSARADLPLTVANDLDQDVQVQVRLRPGSPRLIAEDAVPVTVAAGASERVAVPVRAIASGNTDVSVQLLTPDGEPIGEPVMLTVRVRADWESRGTLGLAVVAGLVLAVGLVRTIRRGRATSSLPVVDRSAPENEDREQ